MNPLQATIEDVDKAVLDIEDRLNSFTFEPPLDRKNEDEDEDNFQGNAPRAMSEKAVIADSWLEQGESGTIAYVQKCMDTLKKKLLDEMKRRESMRNYLCLVLDLCRELKRGVDLRRRELEGIKVDRSI